MNKFFVGKAMGVKEPQEKILPKALEDKDFMRNKTQITKEKFERGNLKMKEFSAFKGNDKINFFSGNAGHKHKFQHNKPKFNMLQGMSNKHDLSNLKRKSDVFLNTNYNKGDVEANAIKSKFQFYSNQGMKKKKVHLNKFTDNFNSKKFKLPIKDLKSKNQQYGLTPRATGGVTVYDEINRPYQEPMPSETERIDRATVVDATVEQPMQDVQPEIMDANVYDVNEELGKTGAAIGSGLKYVGGKLTGGLKYIYEGAKKKYSESEFARDREIAKDYADLERLQKEQLLQSPIVKGEYMKRVKARELNKLYRQADKGVEPRVGFAGAAVKTLEAVGRGLGDLGKAANMTPEKYRQLGGFKVGPGFRYTVQSGLPMRSTASKFEEYTGRDSSGRKLMGGYTPQPMYQQPAPLPPYPQEKTATSLAEAKKAYLAAMIKERLSGKRDYSVKGTEKLLRELENVDAIQTRRPAARPVSRQPTYEDYQRYAAEQQSQPVQVPRETQTTLQTRYRKKSKDKGASAFQKQKAAELGYTIAPEDVDPRFGEKVIVEGEEKVISPYGDIVARLKGGQKKLDQVEMRPTQYIE